MIYLTVFLCLQILIVSVAYDLAPAGRGFLWSVYAGGVFLIVVLVLGLVGVIPVRFP